MKRERFHALMESGALAAAAEALAGDRLRAGDTVSHYRIVEEIGHGGMGVVYRAFDTKLERDVALKVLLSGQRLWREARTAASLKHPNIGVVYEIGEAGETAYLAMELLEGESLAERQRREPLQEPDALAVAVAVADGLAHAHSRGVVHRDLKPANVMLTEHGPKIIDFGLAGSPEDSVGMGTPRYAAPEQVRGEASGPSADVYSFGVLLDELLGTRYADMAKRCRADNPEDRMQSAAEVSRLLRGSDPGHRTWRWVAAAAAVAAIAAMTFWARSRDASFAFLNPRQVTSDVGAEENARWSPSGDALVYQANLRGNWDIWLLEEGERPVNLTSDYDGADRFPTWSPDGAEVAFWSERGGGSVGVMPVSSGEWRRIASADTPAPPRWSRDGLRLAFIDGASMVVWSLGDGTHERVALPGERTRRFDLTWSPDGRFVSYIDANAEVDEVTQLWALRLDDETPFRLSRGDTNVWSPSWSVDPEGLLFVSNQGGVMDLWHQRFERDGPAGEPEQLTVGVGIRNASLSKDGSRLVYSQGRKVANVWRIPISDPPVGWDDAIQLTLDQALIEFVDVSRDGERLVVSSDRAGNQDLWTLPAEGGELRQMTVDPSADWAPVWSPEGASVAFYSYRSGNRDLWLIPEGGTPRQLTHDPAEDYRMAFSPDGGRLLFDSTRSGSWDIWLLDLESGELAQLTSHPAIDSDARFSPDGARIVFGSKREGAYHLWATGLDGRDPTRLTERAGAQPSLRPRRSHRLLPRRLVRERGTSGVSTCSRAKNGPATALRGRRGAMGASALSDRWGIPLLHVGRRSCRPMDDGRVP